MLTRKSPRTQPCGPFSPGTVAELNASTPVFDGDCLLVEERMPIAPAVLVEDRVLPLAVGETPTTTVLELLVIGDPSPPGGLPVIVTVLAYEPADWSALSSRCVQV